MKLSPTEKMMVASIAFTILMLATRVVYSQTITYLFYAWNLFLAAIPMCFSRKLVNRQTMTKSTMILLAIWLLFLPNAPYLVTDLFHYRERPPVPKWFDLLLVNSATWNGLLLGLISLMQVESFLQRCYNRRVATITVISSMLLSGYGIYIGRYLRFNSWDVIADPRSLFYAISQHILLPTDHLSVWRFTILFAVMLFVLYQLLKHLPSDRPAPYKKSPG